MRMQLGMYEKYECVDCEETFYVKRFSEPHYCPFCGDPKIEHDGVFFASMEETSD
ncbi:MAG: hypothetical protein E7L01_09705 [Paenibacillus macerans]|uniref:Uncharacterized protein n=1 Tax=Paenibacillus macerans TaxID=44252 RepID=A0A090ZT20_PAEMA|nr:hypothetical protein [Paenibacillus macerans]KFN07281.1 hypothetical protein DJ90_5684 [Paenibacillus macerans]MCY7558239.1 hypothetical protein [Paenibacillus macerans]MDU5947655.1 hypothetical protein [Paenibacillus macerans]MDU7473600.1 hypothetical protein [Paenibacillus macerans]MEC0139184.1 hypothetical protein [Paenibacillus macerans]